MTRQQRKDDQQIPKRAIIYCRVSSDDQENNTSLETQDADCREWAATNNVEIVAVVWEVYTGTLLWERKELERVRCLYRDGFANMVIVRTFDRLSRTLAHFAILTEEMQRYNVELEAAKEHTDKSQMGWVARIIMSALAEVEHQKIIERTVTGRRNTVLMKKKIIPSWKPRYGYQYDDAEKGKRTRFLMNDKEADVIRFIHKRYDAGISISDLVRELIAQGVKPPHKAWTRTAVLRILRYRPYTGKGQFFTEHKYNARYPIEPVDIPEGLIPQIIDEELFERNQERLTINQQEAARNNEQPEDFLLRAGHIYCAECGRRMHGKRRLRGKDKQSLSLTYVCTASSELNTEKKPCVGQRVNAAHIDRQVWEYVELLAEDSEKIVRLLREAIASSDFSSNMKALRNSIATWESLSERYQQDLHNPHLQGPARDVVLQQLSNTEQTLAGMRIELQKLAAREIDEKQLQKRYENLILWFERIQDGQDMPYAMRRDLLRFLGLKVYIHKTEQRGRVIVRRHDIVLELPEFAEIVIPQLPYMQAPEVIVTIPPEVIEQLKERGAIVESDARRDDGTDTPDGDIASRALCAQFGTAQR